MIKKILTFLEKNPGSKFNDIYKGLQVKAQDCNDDFLNLLTDNYISKSKKRIVDNKGRNIVYPIYRLTPKGLEFLQNLTKNDKLIEKDSPQSSDFKKIFISHSYLDRKIADKIIDKLLLPILSIEKKDIFYTSNRETGIPISKNWRNKIKITIKESKIYIALITTNFQKSEMCLNELGAAWVLDRTIYPIILPPVSLNNFSLLISDLQALDISNPVDIRSFLDSLKSDLKNVYNLNAKSDINIEEVITKYIKSLRQFLRKNPSIFKLTPISKRDRKTDLIITPYLGDPDDELLRELECKYFDISIENKSNQSIEIDVEMKVRKSPESKIISEHDLKNSLKQQFNKSKNQFNYGLSSIEIEPMDLDVHFKDNQDYIHVSRIKLRNQRYALILAQQEIENDVFNKKIIIINKGSDTIKAELIIRSDDFSEGILLKQFEI